MKLPSCDSTKERTNLELRMGALWAVSVGVCSKATLHVAGMNARKSDGDASHGDVEETAENFFIIRS